MTLSPQVAKLEQSTRMRVVPLCVTIANDVAFPSREWPLSQNRLNARAGAANSGAPPNEWTFEVRFGDAHIELQRNHGCCIENNRLSLDEFHGLPISTNL